MQARFVLLIAALPLIGFSSGCAISLHPLSDEKSSIADKQLIGEWEVSEKDKDEPDRFKVEPKSDSQVAMLVKNLKAGDKKPPMTLLATKLGKRRYLSLGGRNEERNRLEWLIAEYDWRNKDSFRMRLLNPKRVRQEVEAGRIKGHVEEREQADDDGEPGAEGTAVIWIEESTNDLRSFLERNPEKLFTDEWTVFKRAQSDGSTNCAGKG